MERRLAQYYMQSGTAEYERGNYGDAEKIFQMAQRYRDNLEPLDQRKLDSMLTKASQAAVERKRALDVKRTAELSLRKGEVAAARAQLEGIKGNQFLTEKERLEVAEILRASEQPGAPGTGLDNVVPPTAISPVGGAPQTAPGQMTGQEKDQLAALYYQSMVAYYSGDLQKAKQGFSEMLKSDLLPAPTAKAVRGYLSQIAVEEAKSAGTPSQTAATAPPTPTMSVMGAAAPYRAANESGAGVPQSELTRIQELYNRSWELYAAGQLEEARKGFVEVAKSGLFAAPEGKRPEDYIATIDRLLSEEAKAAVDANQPPPANATAPAVSASTAPREANVTPLAAAPTGQEEGGYVQVINRRRNLIRGRTQAVVNDAVDQAQKYMAQGEFDQARDACFNAQRIVNQNQLYLGDALYRQYTQQLETTGKNVDEAEALRKTQQGEERRKQAVQDEQDYRRQAELDRKQRIDDYMGRAKAYQSQQRYEAALGQLEAIVALDPLNDEALRMKQMVEDTIYLRRQLDLERLSNKETANIFLQMDETGVPYANEITYPKNWREISEKPTRKPDEPIQLDPANMTVYEQLEQVVDLSSLTPQMGLSEAIDILKKSVDPPLNVVVLWRELFDNAQIEPTTPINMDGLPSVKLGTALENLLNAMSNPQLDIRLKYLVNKGVVTIGTDLSLPAAKMETRVYDISDLVGEPANYAQMGSMMSMMGGMMGGGMMGGYGGMGGGMMGGYGGMGGGMGGYGGMGGGMGMGGYGGMGGGMMGGYGGMGGGMSGGYGGMGGMSGGYGGMGGMMGGGMMGGYGGMGGGMMGGYGGGMGMTGYMGGVMAQSLRYLIEQTVEPDTWFDLSDTGEGTITPYPDQQPKKLAIYQTPEVHQQIRDLLDQLRKSLGNQVSIEARFLAVTENFLEDVGLDFDFSYNLGGKWGLVTVDQGSFLTAASTPTQVSGSLGGLSPAAAEVAGGYGSVLDDLQVSLLLRATQGRTDSKSLAAPKVTVLSGESGFFSLNDQVSYALPPNTSQTTQPTLGGGFQQQNVQQNVGFIPIGSYLTIAPTITKDKKHVLLNIMTTQTDLLRIRDHQVQALAQQTTTTGGTTTTGTGQVVTYTLRIPETENSQVMTRVSVPDRGTLLLGGHKITIAADKEIGVPILSKIPIISRLFTNRSSVRDQKVLLILVKPTILLMDETDQEAVAALEENKEIGSRAP